MTRLIDADAIPWLVEGVGDIPVITKEEIDQLPTVDIPTVGESVGAIRCKDCKYYSCGTIEGKHLCMSAKYRFAPTAEDEWCSRAERKENDTDRMDNQS